MGERRTPLLEAHARLGARLVDFAGWQMPIQYVGVVSEHNAVRTDAGVFDVSHLGKLRCRGRVAGDALQHAMTADVASVPPGRAKYSLVLTDEGGCVDDVFVYSLAEDEWLVVPNAANVEAVGRQIEASGGSVVDEWDRWAILALQGPRSFEIFDAIWPHSGATDMKLHRWMDMDFSGEPGMVARTGYTGERGFELYVPSGRAEAVFTALLDAGAAPIGLGARDTLRLEMGYALYGHEIDLETNPLEAGLGWAIAWDGDFRGKAALEKVKAQGPARRSFGIRCTGKGVPRQGHKVFADGSEIGEVVSGNFSPTLGTGIAVAYAPSSHVPEPGAQVEVDARGRRIAGDIVKPPFIER